MSFGRNAGAVVSSRATNVLLVLLPLIWPNRQPKLGAPAANARTLAVTSMSYQPEAAPNAPCPSAVAATSLAPNAPATCQETPVAATFQFDCSSLQLLSIRLTSTAPSRPSVLFSESVAEAMVAPSGTGPPSRAKMAKRMSGMYSLGFQPMTQVLRSPKFPRGELTKLWVSVVPA